MCTVLESRLEQMNAKFQFAGAVGGVNTVAAGRSIIPVVTKLEWSTENNSHDDVCLTE